jgi:DNA-binding NarL/FixJ family response regulator
VAARVIKVLVADDQRLVREGLVNILRLTDGVEVAGAAADGEEAVAMTKKLGPDVVLMDLRMPRLNGVEATRLIKEARPATRVIVLTTYADDQSIFDALEAGARGYLTKDAGPEELKRAIETVHAGHALLDPSVQARVLDRLGKPAPPRHADANPDRLTAREVEVLRLIARGLSNAEIKAKLFVSEATVKTHINNIFSKIGARDRAHAVTYAYSHGLAGDNSR